MVKMNKIIFYTDIGTDVDDLLALTFAYFADKIDIRGIVTTHAIPLKRAQIAAKALQYLDRSVSASAAQIPIGAGTSSPLSDGELYITGSEGKGFIDKESYDISSAQDVFESALSEDNVSVVALAPLTDLAILYQRSFPTFDRIASLYIQARARFEEGKLIPDESSFNIRVDMEAARIVLSQDNPMVFSGKGMAYQAPINEKELQKIRDTGHPVGEEIYNSCHRGLQHLAKEAPKLYDEIYLKHDAVCYPYDPLTVMALAYPEFFEFEEVNGVRRGAKTRPEAKAFLIETIVKGLADGRDKT